MTTYEIVTTVVAVLSIGVNVYFFRKKGPAHAQTAIQIFKTIDDAETRIREWHNANSDFLLRTKKSPTVAEKNKRDTLTRDINGLNESFLNALDMACSQYLSGALDEQFHEDYWRKVQMIVESDEYNEYFRFGRAHTSIKRVYERWFTPKK